MTRTSFRRAAAPGIAVLTLGLGLTGCAAGNEEASTNSAATVEGASGTLNGAGASSQEAAMAAWQAGFQTANPEVTVNYDPVGSGGGREQFIAGGVEFAGSDSYLDDEEGELSGAKKRCLNEDPIEVPNYVSPIAVVYNLEGVDNLQLSAPVIAEIFDGKITKWNDPKIAAENPDADLPAETITPVHRADDSGTTDNFTDYLSQAGEGAWPHEPEGLWPTKGGEAASGTSGLVAAVKNGTGTIGYADASQAGDLGVASVKVGEEYVQPTPEAAAKVLEVSPPVEGRAEVDMAFELDRKTTEAGAYPVVLTSYLIACQTYESKDEADLVKGFLTYVVGDEGQQAAAETAGSAPLPASLQEKALGIVEKISAKS
ncbi:phosphate ABC transporter substrate-binding protein PstS [Nocardioides sp. WL0053]|uniref:Phosphate-binding protein n=1 Tax=Nocardioides jiangsuensis TaxID=2866161 RepID=A0ABS7RIW5_9ACTN|nr:phosphate ABC transporter substrate-binding protein PstS [Nocardioides jiangsuensis]MBY9074946.1 phosphate ABC transporter substrate-binding protein PstS [Nocardioides jiangsuensis]